MVLSPEEDYGSARPPERAGRPQALEIRLCCPDHLPSPVISVAEDTTRIEIRAGIVLENTATLKSLPKIKNEAAFEELPVIL